MGKGSASFPKGADPDALLIEYGIPAKVVRTNCTLSKSSYKKGVRGCGKGEHDLWLDDIANDRFTIVEGVSLGKRKRRRRDAVEEEDEEEEEAEHSPVLPETGAHTGAGDVAGPAEGSGARAATEAQIEGGVDVTVGDGS